MNLATIHVRVIIQLSLLCLVLVSVCSYNVETEKVGFATGEPGSQFGYTVAIIKKPGWTDAHMNNVPFIKKQLLVGAPNETFNNIRGHGQVRRCEEPQVASSVSCESLNLTDEYDMCAKLMRNGGTSNCNTDSRLGMTLEVNKNFKENMNNNYIVPMITVCAPGWKNVYPELDPRKYQNYMIGMCLKLRSDLTTIRCDKAMSNNRIAFDFCWPFWPTSDTTTNEGQPVYIYAEAGMAAAFTEDGLEVISGPGADNWRGAYRSYGKGWTYRQSRTTPNTLYFGYSLATGKFSDSNIVAGVPNWYSPPNHGYYGKVEMFKDERKYNDIVYGLSLMSTGCREAGIGIVQNLNDIIDKDQTGSKYGATVKTVDITGDGYDEIFVAAPMYTGERPDEGRVFVYTTIGKNVCGPIGVLSGAASDDVFKELSAFARFGSSIASVGDLNKDGYNDVAIGAPYEDNGSGALYIYHGIGDCKCVFEDKFSQRIPGSHVSPDIKSFGWSIYGEEDIDDNSYPDFAVGAYQSDTVALFRTRPIVELMVELKIEPAPIPLDGKLLNCSSDKIQLCFEVFALFQYKSLGTRIGNVSEIKFAWTIKADTVYKNQEGTSRIAFRENTDDVLMENITLSRNGKDDVVSKTYIMDVKGHNGKPEPRDAWTLVRMEGNFELLGTSGSNFQDLDAVLPENAPTKIIENVEFNKQCESIDLCKSDLTISVDMFLLKHEQMPIKVDNNTVIYVDEANELEITVDVKNLVNSSYRANVSGEVTALLRRDVLPNNGIIGATCKYGETSPLIHETMMNCTADSKLDKNENFKVKFYFDISRVRLIPNLNINYMLKSIQVNYKAQQINHDIDNMNNMFHREIAIKMKFDVSIEEDKDTSDQVRYAADIESTRKIRLIHRYYITNNGPSFLPRTLVNITIPVKWEGVTIATVLTDKLPAICQLRGFEPVVQTTTARITTTDDFDIPSPNPQKRRRRREANETTTEKLSESKTKTETTKNITCVEGSPDCAIIECRITNLEKSQQATVEIEVDLYEKELAKKKNVREVRFITNATVTDPHIWFGGKSVPWENTVFAEKTTLLVVETASIVDEVNIWIIIGAVLGAIALLVIVIIVLYLCGFFNRKKHSEVQNWKRASLYNKKSMRLSRTVNQPYSAVGEGGDAEN